MEESVERYCATGKRKRALARVIMMAGSGVITVNKRSIDEYFTREVLKMIIRQPLDLTGTLGKYDIRVNVNGGGLSGQADAVKHGISKNLIQIDPGLRGVLKKEGFLTRDSRIKERKKYGLRGARRSCQYSKR